MLSKQNPVQVEADALLRLTPNVGVRRHIVLVLVCLLPVVAKLLAQAPSRENRDWPVYGGAPENQHYSPLIRINRSNVRQLQVAWTFDIEETGGLQTSPLVVDGVLYGISPTQRCRDRQAEVEIRFRDRGHAARPRPGLLEQRGQHGSAKQRSAHHCRSNEFCLRTERG
jgi:hypothetical protein